MKLEVREMEEASKRANAENDRRRLKLEDKKLDCVNDCSDAGN